MKACFLGHFILFLAASGYAGAQQSASGEAQPYKGFETRSIKSLSATDIAEISAGAGWGLALAAELNGKPGPAHVLEHQEALGLSAEQVDAITAIHEQMKAEAKAAGAVFIAAEKALSDAFAGDDLTPDALQSLLADAAAARAALRYVHLVRHLETPPILTPHQIRRYNQLRGYADDPCTRVPAGHDATMWRRHNGCE